ncbi:hypothetical protein BGZ73_001288 [Actinomortierella ambigua]|nr:hypothetical protein BGZ73_001288 [Actinomortierella ambigua]
MKFAYVAVLAASIAVATAQQDCCIRLKFSTYDTKATVPVIDCIFPNISTRDCFNRANSFAAIYKGLAFEERILGLRSFYELESNLDLSQGDTFTDIPATCGILGGQVGQVDVQYT